MRYINPHFTYLFTCSSNVIERAHKRMTDCYTRTTRVVSNKAHLSAGVSTRGKGSHAPRI